MADAPRSLVELDGRARRLRAALAAVLVRGPAPELALVHRWLANWMGVGLITVRIKRQGLRLPLSHMTASPRFDRNRL
jgi:hypothetical protein